MFKKGMIVQTKEKFYIHKKVACNAITNIFTCYKLLSKLFLENKYMINC